MQRDGGWGSACQPGLRTPRCRRGRHRVACASACVGEGRGEGPRDGEEADTALCRWACGERKGMQASPPPSHSSLDQQAHCPPCSGSNLEGDEQVSQQAGPACADEDAVLCPTPQGGRPAAGSIGLQRAGWQASALHGEECAYRGVAGGVGGAAQMLRRCCADAAAGALHLLLQHEPSTLLPYHFLKRGSWHCEGERLHGWHVCVCVGGDGGQGLPVAATRLRRRWGQPGHRPRWRTCTCLWWKAALDRYCRTRSLRQARPGQGMGERGSERGAWGGV